MGDLCLSNSTADIKQLHLSIKLQLKFQTRFKFQKYTLTLVGQQRYQQSPMSPFASSNKIWPLWIILNLMSHRHISTNTLQQANSQHATLMPKKGCHNVIPPFFVLLNRNIHRSTISLADPEAYRPPVQMSIGGFFSPGITLSTHPYLMWR